MQSKKSVLREVAALFLKLGLIAFGGPAAHIAMMEEEVVTRRKWISRQHFLDLVGATNLIPGPNSTEMTMHVGYERGGWRGLFVAGSLFIFPAVLITGILAWFYVTYGSLPQVEPFLYGIKPAVIAVIASALWRLGKKAVKGWRLFVLGGAVLVSVLFGADEVLALLVGGVVGMLWLRYSGTSGTTTGAGAILVPFKKSLSIKAALLGASTSAAGVSLWKLGLFFLKIGAILYGSGYVLVAFLEGGLVQDYGWLTQQQLLDAVAIGQFTPGPVLSTATFIGYVIAGASGAAVATVGIFLPSFIFVLILNPIIPKLRKSVWTAAFLDAVNVAAVALMAAVTIELSMSTLTTWTAWVIVGLSIIVVFRYKVNPAWVILGGAILGYLLKLLHF